MLKIDSCNCNQSAKKQTVNKSIKYVYDFLLRKLSGKENRDDKWCQMSPVGVITARFSPQDFKLMAMHFDPSKCSQALSGRVFFILELSVTFTPSVGLTSCDVSSSLCALSESRLWSLRKQEYCRRNTVSKPHFLNLA